jgi:methionine salvage enolase-phosphatase E1
MDITNDPDLNGKYLGTVSQDFVKIADHVKEASYQIRKRGFSDYPIFIISKEDIPIGQLLFKKDEIGTIWNYYVTYIDEFIQRKIISKDKADLFMEAYKNPDEFCCLFVIDGDFTNFVYLPYPVD